MKKVSLKQLKQMIAEELGVQPASKQKASPPPIPDAAKNKSAEGGLSNDAKKYVGLVKQAHSHLSEILREIETGSGTEGTSAYYVGQELEKVMQSLVKPVVFFKKKSGRQG